MAQIRTSDNVLLRNGVRIDLTNVFVSVCMADPVCRHWLRCRTCQRRSRWWTITSTCLPGFALNQFTSSSPCMNTWRSQCFCRLPQSRIAIVQGFFCYFPQLVVLLQAADYVAGQAMSARQNCFIVSCYLLLFVEYKITNCKYCSCLIGVHTNRGKSSNLKLRISRPGKVVEKALGRRKFWKSPWKWNVVVLEFYRVTWLSVTWFQLSRYSNPAWPIAVQ